MPIFKYLARDLKGQDYSGQIESSDPHQAAVSLRRRGLVVISVKTGNSPTWKFFDRFFSKVSSDEIVNFTRQLATMIEAGLVLSEAIDILAEQQTNKKFRAVLDEVTADIKGGLSLAASLGKHGDIFPSLYINLIKAGEISGKLDEVLLRMADNLEKEREFRSRIKGAMIYPVVVLSMMGMVIVLMMAFVIPKLTGFYAQSTLELPLPTKILIGISTLFTTFWWALLALIIAASLTFRHILKNPAGKLTYDRMLLRIPRIGKLITNITMTDFTRTFSLLTTAGVPLLESITIVLDVTQNSVFKNGLKRAYSGVVSGLTFSQQLLLLPEFPRLVGQMVRVGEETGKLDEVFGRLANYFESESDHAIKNLTVAIEPVILVILGMGVAFLVISIILPIYKLTTSF